MSYLKNYARAFPNREFYSQFLGVVQILNIPTNLNIGETSWDIALPASRRCPYHVVSRR